MHMGIRVLVSVWSDAGRDDPLLDRRSSVCPVQHRIVSMRRKLSVFSMLALAAQKGIAPCEVAGRESPPVRWSLGEDGGDAGIAELIFS